MLSLFIVALLSATLLPGGSEAWLATLWCQGESAIMLWIVATTGNSLGSLVNVALGRFAREWVGRRWFPASERGLQRAERWYMRGGEATLLLAWVPILGDPLTVMAGIVRLPWWRATAWILLSKGGRYAVLLWAAERWLRPLCTG